MALCENESNDIYLPAPSLYYKFPSRKLSISNQAVYNCHGLKINIHLVFFKVAINIGNFLLCLHDMQIYVAMSVNMNLKKLQETGEDRNAGVLQFMACQRVGLNLTTA